MKMTDAERLTLIRLHEILAILKPKEAKEHHNAIQILRDGYHEDLYEQIGGIYLSDPFPEAEQNRVYEILDLYATLNRSYAKLSKQDKKAIDKGGLNFPGFDGLNEPAHAAFAKFVVKKQHRWSELDHRSDFDAGRQMLPVYEEMLKVARKIESESGDLSAAEISSILAQMQPAETAD